MGSGLFNLFLFWCAKKNYITRVDLGFDINSEDEESEKKEARISELSRDLGVIAFEEICNEPRVGVIKDFVWFQGTQTLISKKTNMYTDGANTKGFDVMDPIQVEKLY